MITRISSRAYRIVSIGAATLVLLVGFQNCSGTGVNFESADFPSVASESPSNGHHQTPDVPVATTPPPRPPDEPLPPPPPRPIPPDDSHLTPPTWQKYEFDFKGSSSCNGPRYIIYAPKYALWVGAQLCGSVSEYKLYLSSEKKGIYLQVADYAGHGQDHCELVNSKFKIPNEDDITSGGCKDCAVNGLIDVQNELVFARAKFGEPFKKVVSGYWADLTTHSYRCGVDIGTMDPVVPAKSCPAQKLSLKYSSNQGYGMESWICSGPMPESPAGKKGVWGAPASSGSMTGESCKYGNKVGAHNHVLTSQSAGTCKHYCTLIADCGSDGQWKNITYTW